jgi:hypothetical protein
MDYATTTPVDLAAAITAAAAKRPAYRAVRRDGAAQAAAHLADILSGGSRCTSASGRAV